MLDPYRPGLSARKAWPTEACPLYIFQMSLWARQFHLVVVAMSCLAVSCLAVSCCARVEPQITGEELRGHVEFLASDDLAGRYVGTEGVRIAEEYIAGQFAETGLSPLPGEEDYFLEFELQSASYSPSTTYLAIGESTFQAGVGFRPFPFSDSGTVEGEVVFAGYGITAPEYGHDDYEDLNVQGKIVLIMRHEPNETDTSEGFGGRRLTDHALFKTKAENAVDHGAAGMLLYTDALHHDGADDLRTRHIYGFAGGNGVSHEQESTIAEGFLAFHVSLAVAGKLMPGAGLADIQRSIDEGTRPADLPSRAGGLVRMSQQTVMDVAATQARNVAAFLVGQGPLADEWVLIGAHHDHIGSFSGTGDTVYNGADDNASGVSAVLELAEQFASFPSERSIVFMTFAAEEVGLFGSKALDVLGLIDFERLVFMLNLDMIGRNPSRRVEVYGDGFTDGLGDIVLDANTRHELEVRLMGRTYEPFSDMAVFHDHGIPFLMLFTGEHEDYHGAGDHADRIDYERMTKIVNLSYDILARVAGSEEQF